MNEINKRDIIVELKEEIALNSTKDIYYLRRGNAYIREGYDDEAIKDFTTALEINPKRAYSWGRRARIYYNKHNYVEAVNNLTEAIKLGTKPYSIYYYTRALCYIEMQNYVQAINDLTEAIKLNPNHPFYYLLRASTTIKAGDISQSIHNLSRILRDLCQAIRIESKLSYEDITKMCFFQLYKNCSLYYLRNQYYYKAINNLNKAIKIALTERYNSDISNTLYFLRVSCYEQENEFLKAINDISKIVAQGWESDILKHLLIKRGYFYRMVGKYNEAINDLNIIEYRTSSLYFINLLSIRSACYYEVGEYNKALEDLRLLKKEFDSNKKPEKIYTLLDDKLSSVLGISKEEIYKFEQRRELFKGLIYKSIDHNYFIGIIRNENCPISFFLEVLEILFELNKFKFYRQKSEELMTEAHLLDFFIDKENSEKNYSDFCSINKQKNTENLIKKYESLKRDLEKNGSKIFFANVKISLLEAIAGAFIVETLSLPKNERTADRFHQQSNFMLIFFKIQKVLQERYQELLENKEHEKAQAKIEERNKVIADLSHSIKNLISTVIDPLENMKKEAVVKQPIIDSAIRGANLVREIVNAMNLSYKGSIEDFRYDAKNNSGNDKQDIKMMILESLKSSVGNMYDGKYFSAFQEGYFQLKQSFINAKLDWNADISQSKNLEEISGFLKKYFFELFIEIAQTENFIIGNERGSAVKLLILFGELILNAIKYSAFVERENRFVKIEILHNPKQISVLIENRYNPRKNIKTTGLGNVVITNFAKLLNTSPMINRENDIYSVQITFENFWEKGSSA